MTDSEKDLPPAALLVRHRVADFDAWKAAFDDHESARRAAGILGHRLNRAKGDPDVLTVYLPLSDVERAREFAGSADLQQVMQQAGVVEEPTVSWVRPVRHAVVWEGELPATIITHQVTDFDAWLAGYDRASETFMDHGVVGHAVHRSLDDPSLVVVYHQAGSFEALEKYFDEIGFGLQGEEERDQLMRDASIGSWPEITYCTGGWAKQY